MSSSRFLWGAVTGALALLCAVGICLPSSPVQAQTQAQTPPSNLATSHALYQEKCSACHNLPDPAADPRTRPQWRRTVARMVAHDQAQNGVSTISPADAMQIISYLATFAPASAEGQGRGRTPRNPWDTDTADVWTQTPSKSRVFNFETQPEQAGLVPQTSGVSGPDAHWQTVTRAGEPDGASIKVGSAQADPSRFALLLDKNDRGQDLDMQVQFQIFGAPRSASVGLVFGLTDNQTYFVLRCDTLHKTLSLIQIAGAQHTTLQQTALDAASAKLGPGRHTLRLLVRGGQVRGWIDGVKRISTTASAYGGGKIALWTQGDTAAGFDDWTVDFYDKSSSPRTL